MRTHFKNPQYLQYLEMPVIAERVREKERVLYLPKAMLSS